MKATTNAIRLSVCVVATATLALGILHIAWADSGGGCPNETCPAAYYCGGQDGYAYPAGPMSLCTQDQAGKTCNWCDGVAQLRRCITGTQTRQCIRPKTPTVCGNPKKGVCTQASVFGKTYWYCKDNGSGAGTHSCSMIDQCTGDEPCP